MAITWGTVKSLLIFFGPILLPKAIAYYRSVRAAPTINGIPIRPLPPAVSRALTVLFITAVCFLFKILLSPENVFSLTNSRLQIPPDVLLTRLASIRPHGLTPSDEIFRTKFKSLDSKLLYLHHGPDTLLNCDFCNPDDPNSYLYYSLPAILVPHLFNLCVLGLVTSGFFTGKEGAIWRTTATLTSLAAALVEIYLVSTYNYQANSRSTGLENIDFFFWKARVYRLLALASIDGIIGWLLYLSSTNRAFLKPPTTVERVIESTRILEVGWAKMQTSNVLKNTIFRDQDLMDRSRAYWGEEVSRTEELMGDRDVVDGVRNALEGRINMATIVADAETYAQRAVTHANSMTMANGHV